MNKYIVSVTRISYSHKDISVEANSREEAKDKAIETAGNLNFPEHQADYDIDNIVLRKETENH